MLAHSMCIIPDRRSRLDGPHDRWQRGSLCGSGHDRASAGGGWVGAASAGRGMRGNRRLRYAQQSADPPPPALAPLHGRTAAPGVELALERRGQTQQCAVVVEAPPEGDRARARRRRGSRCGIVTARVAVAYS